MFERLIGRAGRRALERAAARRAELAERLAALGTVTSDCPRVRVEAVEEGVRLSGRELARRFALEPRLRWLIAGLVR